MTNATHPFEAAGLGLAPFRFIGMGQTDIAYGEVCHNREEFNRTGILVSSKRGGTCAFCGEGITYLYEIESADGRKFHVGCDCAHKVASDANDARLDRSIKRAKAKLDASKRAAKSAERAAAREARQAELAATAVDRLGATKGRLEDASRINPVFGEMLERILSGQQESLSTLQRAWLDRSGY